MPTLNQSVAKLVCMDTNPELKDILVKGVTNVIFKRLETAIENRKYCTGRIKLGRRDSTDYIYNKFVLDLEETIEKRVTKTLKPKGDQP